MSGGERISLSEAQALANQLLNELAPACSRIEVVGSIRRQRETVGDIEILAVPSLVPTVDLFGVDTGAPENLLDQHCRKLLGLGLLAHRPDGNGKNSFGTRYKRLLYRGFAVDLFSCLPPAQFGVLKVIRTGSSGFVHRLVTPVEQRGWMPRSLFCHGGALRRVETGQPIETPEEVDVFRAIGRSCVDPELREVGP